MEEKAKVRVMAVADVHGDFEKLDVSGVDIVIVAGDVGPGGTSKGAESDAWAAGRPLLAWFRKHARVRFYILPGNHDLFAKHRAQRKEIERLWPKNAILLKDRGAVDPSGLTLWGMPWNPIHVRKNGSVSASKGGAFAADNEKIVAACEKIKRTFGSLDILVTHAPPQIADTAYGRGGWHMSPALAAMLPQISPRLLVCGHLHQLSHRPITVNGGKTKVVNVSLKLGHDDGAFTYKPRIIDIEIARAIDIAMDEKSEMFAETKLADSDRAWLRDISIRIEKTVRGVNKLIDENHACQTATRPTGVAFNREVDLARLERLAPLDETGRVAKLIEVVKLLKASEAKGWTQYVLPELWHRKKPSRLYPGKKGDVDFAAYRYV